MSQTIDKSQIEAKLSQIKSLIEKGDLQKAWAGCGEILAVNPDNEFVQKLKAEIEKTGKIMSTGQKNEVSVKDLRCPSCRSPLNISQQESESATCGNCGSVLDLSEGELAILGKVDAGQFSPESFIRLGKIATLSGKKYQVIGRICFSASIREWDPEDNCYYTEPWNFDEWVLVGENKEYLYLSEDREGYELARSMTPTAPKIPEPSQQFMSLFKDRPAQRILEDARNKIEYFEGEFTWLPKIGGYSRSIEYADFEGKHSVSSNFGEDGKTVEEVEFFTGHPISRLDLAHAFDEQEIIQEELKKAAAQEEYKKWSWAFLTAAAFCLVLLVVSCGGGGSKIGDFSANLATIPEQGVIKGPFTLSKKGSIHRIELTTSIPDNSWSWGAMELLDSNQAAINALEGDFWRESGYDDGHWSERDTSRDYYFRLEKPGVYYARLFVEKGTASSGTLRVQVFQGIYLSRYYLLGFLFCLGFGIAIWRYKTVNPLYVVVGLLALGVFILSHMGDDD